jgi:hypothetical protein
MEWDRSLATRGLRRRETPRLAGDNGDLLSYVQLLGIQVSPAQLGTVDIEPAESERFADAQSSGKHDRVQLLELMSARHG